MLRRTFSAAALAALLLAPLAFAADDEKKEAFDAKCPVSGRAANKDFAVAFKGKQVYFCCPNCPEAFKSNTEKFEAAAHRQLANTGQIVQVACPLTGRKINPEKTTKVGGVEVAFCCGNCLAKVEKASDGDAQALVFASLDKGFTLQSKCPVSGRPIDPSHSVKYKGATVYFCCPNCPAAFKKDPEKFADKLPQLKKEKSE